MLEDYFETFTRQVETPTSAPLGGKKSTWADGATFQAGISKNNSREAQIAYRSGLAAQYVIVVPDGVVLAHDERVKRSSDGRTYRITSNSGDMHTPTVAYVQYSQATAEVIE